MSQGRSLSWCSDLKWPGGHPTRSKPISSALFKACDVLAATQQMIMGGTLATILRCAEFGNFKQLRSVAVI
jgi:hypothetical protein